MATECVLRRVTSTTSSRSISRDEARNLWKQGKIAGLFNIPFENEALFEACTDFCVETGSIEELLVQPDIEELKTKNRNLQAANVEILKTVKKLKEELSIYAAKELTHDEEGKNQLEKVQFELAKERHKHKEAMDRLHTSLQKVKNESAQLLSQVESKDKEINSLKHELERERRRKTEMEQQLAECRTDKDRYLGECQQWKHSMDVVEDEIKQIRSSNELLLAEIEELKEKNKDLASQNKELCGRLQEAKNTTVKLSKENEVLVDSQFSNLLSPNQHDKINKHLLYWYQQQHFDNQDQHEDTEDEWN